MGEIRPHRGRTITDVKIRDGEEIGTAVIRMILKTSETISLYTKGLGYDSQIFVRSPGIEENQFHRLFLEEVAQDEFRVIKAESIPEQESSTYDGSLGYLALILEVVLAFYLKDN